jgi:iron uptake system component EfeO
VTALFCRLPRQHRHLPRVFPGCRRRAVDAIHIAGDAQTLLDEIARTRITGEEDTCSHTDLWDFRANIDGSQAAVASVRPILDARKSEVGQHIDQRFAGLDAELAQSRRGNGYVSYGTVDQAHRTVLWQRIDALCAVVSQVQALIAG